MPFRAVSSQNEIDHGYHDDERFKSWFYFFRLATINRACLIEISLSTPIARRLLQIPIPTTRLKAPAPARRRGLSFWYKHQRCSMVASGRGSPYLSVHYPKRITRGTLSWFRRCFRQHTSLWIELGGRHERDHLFGRAYCSDYGHSLVSWAALMSPRRRCHGV